MTACDKGNSYIMKTIHENSKKSKECTCRWGLRDVDELKNHPNHSFQTTAL